MKTDLDVPFEQKEQAKSLGARWDATKKIWFVPDGVDVVPFVNWIPELKLTRKQVKVLRRKETYRSKRSVR